MNMQCPYLVLTKSLTDDFKVHNLESWAYEYLILPFLFSFYWLIFSVLLTHFSFLSIHLFFFSIDSSFFIFTDSSFSFSTDSFFVFLLIHLFPLLLTHLSFIPIDSSSSVFVGQQKIHFVYFPFLVHDLIIFLAHFIMISFCNTNNNRATKIIFKQMMHLLKHICMTKIFVFTSRLIKNLFFPLSERHLMHFFLFVDHKTLRTGGKYTTRELANGYNYHTPSFLNILRRKY